MRALPDVLERYLDKSGMSQVEFARRVGISASSVNKILKGRHAPRYSRASIWCDVLGLTGKDAEVLTDAIHLAAASPRVRAIVKRLERQAARLKK